MNKAIVVGASSGIGRELAILLGDNGYAVAVGARRQDLLEELVKEHENIDSFRVMDVANCDQAMGLLEELIQELGGVDLIVVAAGTGSVNEALNWQPELETIETNVSGFTAIVNVAMKHFLKQGSGHLVGISSIASIRGGRSAPAYNASKAYQSNYLEGMRQKVKKMGALITVTEIIPGFVDTAMAKGEGIFWSAPPKKAATQIFAAIRRKKSRVYITKRWRLVAWLLKLLPAFIYERL